MFGKGVIAKCSYSMHWWRCTVNRYQKDMAYDQSGTIFDDQTLNQIFLVLFPVIGRGFNLYDVPLKNNSIQKNSANLFNDYLPWQKNEKQQLAAVVSKPNLWPRDHSPFFSTVRWAWFPFIKKRPRKSRLFLRHLCLLWRRSRQWLPSYRQRRSDWPKKAGRRLFSAGIFNNIGVRGVVFLGDIFNKSKNLAIIFTLFLVSWLGTY